MNRPRLLHVGSAVVDFVYRIGSLPAAGTERIARSFDMVAGGGFNMMVAAKRAGMAVAYGGQHGTGPYGDFLRRTFAENGIALLQPPSARADSGNCVVMITDDAERTFVSWPGAEGTMTARELAAIAVGEADWVFTSGYTLSYAGSRAALSAWIAALPDTVAFVFDPTPVVGDIPGDILSAVLSRTTWLSCNSHEAEVITGSKDPQRQARAVLDTHCPCAVGVVIRAGASGSHLQLRGGKLISIPGFRVDAIDTNGAGDSHIGAFVSALAQAAAPAEAVRYANAAAAISVTRHGGSSAPEHHEIIGFLERTEPGNPEQRT